MHGGSTPSIRRPKHHAPSAAAAAGAAAADHIAKLTTRWEIAAVASGSRDPAAQQQAARALQQLVQYLAQNRSACKQGAVRVVLQKQLPPELLLTLLSSSQEEVVDLTLHALRELAGAAPAVVPVDVAPRLLQLLACRNHGAAAARVITVQLSHWRFSRLWPHWLAAGSTSTVQLQLQQLHALCQAAESLSSATASKAADGCVSMLLLLAKLMLLSEAQLLQQLAPDAQTAGRWLQLLVQTGRQHAKLAGSHTSLQLQDACCALLAGMSHAPATTLAVAASTQQRQQVVQLLHGVLHRPCCVSEADASHIQCWMHAAAAASLPVLWHQRQSQQQQQQQQQQQHVVASALAPHEEQQLLVDIAISAAATLCNECFSVSAVAKQVDGAAASLLAAALLPAEGGYGTQRNCTSRFMAAVLGSNCCHVLLHALAVSTTTTAEQLARLAAAAQAATTAAAIAQWQASRGTGSSRAGDTQPQQPVAAAAAGRSGQVVLAPVQQELQPGWLLLRMICSQCAAVTANTDSTVALSGTRSSAHPFGVSQPATQQGASSSSTTSSGSDSSSMRAGRHHIRQQPMTLLQAASGSARAAAVQPEQVLRVVQAYSCHVTAGSDAQQVPGLLRSLHFLMCQSALVLHHGPSRLLPQGQQHHHQQQRQHQQLEEQHQQRERLQWLSLTTDPSSESCSSDDGEGGQLGTGGHQLLTTAAGVLELILGVEGTPPATPAVARTTTAQLGSGGSSDGGSSSSSSSMMQRLPWTLAASVYVCLAVTVYLQELVPSPAAAAAHGAAASAASVGCLSATDACLALHALQLAAAALKLLLPMLTNQAFEQATRASAPAAAAAEGSLMSTAAMAGFADWKQAQQRQQPLPMLPVYEPLACSLAALQAVGVLSSLLQPALPALLSQCKHSTSGHIGQQVRHSASGSGGGSSRHGAGGTVTVHAAKAAIAAAAAALDSELQQLLAQVVLSWQAPLPTAGSSSSACGQQQLPLLQPSVEAALHLHMLQELRCWSAAALATCYGQLGARTWQGAVLQQFRAPGAAFADVQLQLGDSRSTRAGHAAVLAAGCPVLRQQLLTAAAAAPSSSGLVLKLSAAVEPALLQQVLDFVYTGAAVMPDAGLASQLQLCDTSLNAPTTLQGASKQQHQRLPSLQQRQLQRLHEQQHAAKQQLHKLGMLARKLQLPLLASLTRSHRPQPGQRLPDLHLSFDALLPQQLLLGAAPGAGAGAGGCEAQPEPQQGAQEEHQQHPSSEAYLSMLAATAMTDAPAELAVPSAAALLQHPHHQEGQSQAAAPAAAAASFPDVLLAAPYAAGACHAAAPSEGSSSSASAGQEQGQEQGQHGTVCAQFAYLPAHRVLLSACCPYFEALLSQRWQHDEEDAGSYAALRSEDQQQPQPQEHAVRVVLVAEADIHVAAALQHYLYTGDLRVQLPGHVVALPAAGSDAAGSEAGAPALNGCCPACHQARTLLRLWRCAELLLLPGLQALCVAAVDTAAWHLESRCCLVLLLDCCHLGTPAAADGLLAALAQRAEREHTISLPEWNGLPAGLQGVLIKAWADRRRDQEGGAEPAAAIAGSSSAAPAGVAAAAAPAATPAAAAARAVSQAAAGGWQPGLPGSGVVQPPQLQAGQLSAGPGLQKAPAEAVGVSVQRVLGLQQAAQCLSNAVSTQLRSAGS